MASSKTPPGSLPTLDRVVEQPFDEALSSRYLTYALSTIMARSLPDVRDGLKPVHRRLLYAMRLLKLDPSAGYKKCARVVGDVMGKYHPHGDQAIYDAMVRLAQDFSVRYPLVDGQGNFGNIDGDNPAAMRYTEARLTQAASLLMDGLDEACVGFKPTYDGEDEEPEVFPAGFPNLLANGASGIAVGMATSIPPHNLAELIDGLTLLLDKPDASTDELVKLIPGPDFPTGGVIVEPRDSILQAYTTGRGAFRLRARWAVEDAGRGTWQVVISEIPYQVQKSKLIEQIAQLIADKKLPILEDVRDESDTEVRLVLEPKSRNVDPLVLMESLYKLSDLESRFSLNLNVLDKARTPKVMSLGQALGAYLDHARDVLVARSQHRLNQIDDRLEVLGGYLIAYLNLDEVIRIIREEDKPKPALIARFELTDRQAEAILNIRLRALSKLEEMEIRKEDKALRVERKGLQALIDSPALQTARLKEDFAKLRAVYGPETVIGRRRSGFGELSDAAEIPLEAMIEKEPITVVCSAKGWIRALKSHVDLASAEAMKFKEGDGPRFAFHAQTTDKILIAADTGRFFTLGADKLPGGRGYGEPVRLSIDLEADAEIIVVQPHVADAKFLLASSDGRGFIAPAEALLAETRKGKQVMRAKSPAKLFVARAINGDYIAVVGDNRKLLIFEANELPEMSSGQGVALQKYKDGGLSDAISFTLAKGLSWPMGGDTGRIRTEMELSDWIGKRAAAGRLPPLGFPRNNKFGVS
jgi:topoisomerase IV subunit A